MSVPNNQPINRTVLLIEDDEALRRLLAEVLAEEGYRVIEVRDGVEALRVLTSPGPSSRHHRPDLVISDINIPGLGGIDIAGVLRHDGHDLRFIFITAFGDDDTRERARLLGAAALLDKPFDIEHLLREVKRQLEYR